jgi:hypothetical protein
MILKVFKSFLRFTFWNGKNGLKKNIEKMLEAINMIEELQLLLTIIVI